MLSRRAIRLAMVMAVVLANVGFVGETSAAGVTGTIKLDPPTTQVDNGAAVSIKVVTNTSVPTSGASASISFNKSVLQVTSITRSSAWASAPLFLAGDAKAISTANQKGVLQNVAAAFFPPTSVPAGAQEFITVGFKAIACGTVTMTVPTGRVDSTLLDGRAATYGNTIKLTATGATVTVCQGGAGASPASNGASAAPAASASFDPNASVDPNASASAEPAPSDSPQPGGIVAPSGAAPSASGPAAIDTSLVATTSDQSGWLNLATAALAVAAAGLATLIIVLTVIAIGAAVVGAIVVIRVWRRYAERDARASAASVAPVDATASPSTASDGSLGEREAPPEGPPGTAIPLPTAQT
jgi:hypothetical protein